jgi:hypothetical protein
MNLKKAAWQLTLPLTIITFASLSKWWYVLPIDAPDTMMWGFPLPFAAEGWHTSMSLQIFVLELLADFLLYFLFCFLLVFLANRLLVNMVMPRLLRWLLWACAALLMALAIFVVSFSDPAIQPSRDWDMKVMTSGYKSSWVHQDRPDYAKYAPDK